MNESKEHQWDAFLLACLRPDQLFVNQILSYQIPKHQQVFGALLSTFDRTQRCPMCGLNRNDLKNAHHDVLQSKV